MKYEITFTNGLPPSYKLITEICYYSQRYKKTVICKPGMVSDGATGRVLGIDVPDLPSRSWWVHDQLCNTGRFEDGTTCNNLQASNVISDILESEGRSIRSDTWFLATWLFGGGEARKNGMF
ncbi:MAG: hypothetical protein GY799_13105 [Desulfobulbaceae bacterium]|nr:hypothetical protein [Desulfobulbaceae bacterium]